MRLVRDRPHIAAYVRTLKVQGRSLVVRNPIVAKGTGVEGKVMDVLGDVGIVCRGLRRIELVDMLFEPGLCPHTISILTSLSLTSVTLATFSPHSFASLHSLSLTNIDATFLRHSPTFPILSSLDYHNALLDTDELPVLRLEALEHVGSRLKRLKVGRMFDPAGEWDYEEGEKRRGLEAFVGLESLTLRADSSHRAKSYFPLLYSLSSPSLHTFTISTSLGYRDKQQEVAGMAAELTKRLQAPSFASVRVLELTRVFRPFEGEEAMSAMLEEASRRGVEVRYLEE
ncbi:hypothetical protein RQP46_010075 [Phenoliferia psychrophenolica]